MKAYLITIGLLFAALAALHVYVVVQRGPSRHRSLTRHRAIIAGGMSVWAGRLLLKGRQEGISD
jgi:hypothetical protein